MSLRRLVNDRAADGAESTAVGIQQVNILLRGVLFGSPR
jgi:hypothetical protein